MAARFTSAPPMEGGKRIPTVFCPAQIGRRRRARKMVFASAEKKLSFGVRKSAMHLLEAADRLDGPNQNAARSAFLIGHEIQAVIHVAKRTSTRTGTTAD